MNIAYTDHYAAWRAEQSALIFAPEYRKWDKETELADGYSVRSVHYHHSTDEGMFNGIANELVNSDGQVVFQWNTIEQSHGCFALFCHANGKRYLVFTEELYGYSVLEVESGRVFRYIPETAHPVAEEMFGETFIWTKVFFDETSCMIAVEGCYWACSHSVIVLDFTDPMSEQPTERWLDLWNLPMFRERCCDEIDFVRWDADGLVVRAYKNGEEERCLVPVDLLKYKTEYC